MRPRNSRLLAVTGVAAIGAAVYAAISLAGPGLADERPEREHEVAGLRTGVGPRRRSSSRPPSHRARPGSRTRLRPAARLLLRIRQRHAERGERADHGRLQRHRKHGSAQDRAGQEHLPGLQEGPPGRRPELQLRHRVPLPGPRGRLARLHHADQPGRRREAPRDRAGDEGRPGQRSPRSTAPPGIRGRRGSCSRPRARASRPTRPRRAFRRSCTTSPARSAEAATRASRTTRTATSGSSRTSAARTRPRRTKARSIPNSFVYRYVPASPGDLANGKLQVLQVFNASASRSP